MPATHCDMQLLYEVRLPKTRAGGWSMCFTARDSISWAKWAWERQG